MGQIDHQIVFPLFRLPGGLLGPEGLLPGQIQLVLHALHGGREADGLLRRLGELTGGLNEGLELLVGPGDEVVADDHPPHQNDKGKHKEVIVPHPVEQMVEGVGLVPDQAAADNKAQHADHQHNGHPGHQGKQIVAPGLEGGAAGAPLAAAHLSLLTQWYTPPPKRS